jgi:hypothetical protein
MRLEHVNLPIPWKWVRDTEYNLKIKINIISCPRSSDDFTIAIKAQFVPPLIGFHLLLGNFSHCVLILRTVGFDRHALYLPRNKIRH